MHFMNVGLWMIPREGWGNLSGDRVVMDEGQLAEVEWSRQSSTLKDVGI